MESWALNMKIAFVSDSIYPFNKGGKETRSYELAKRLSMNHDVNFYTMKFFNWNTNTKHGFCMKGICKNYPLYVNKRRSIKQGLAFGLSAFKLFKEDFDVVDADHMVYFHLFPLRLVCSAKKKPLIVTWHEVWGKDYWKSYLGNKGRIGAFIERLASKLPDKIISVSEHTTQKLIKELNVPKEKIVTIPNGIDFEKIQKIKAHKEKSDLIFAGRLLSHKNVDVLIRTLGQIKKDNPKIKLIIIGDGPEKENLESLAKELNLNNNTVFKGFLDNHDEVLSFIKSSKVFVLPSTREGFGISIIEANACGIPVITINHKDNASKFLIQEESYGNKGNKGNGFLCQLDEKDLKEKVKKALKSHKNMSQECKNTSKKYDWNNLISRFEGVYS